MLRMQSGANVPNLSTITKVSYCFFECLFSDWKIAGRPRPRRRVSSNKTRNTKKETGFAFFSMPSASCLTLKKRKVKQSLRARVRRPLCPFLLDNMNQEVMQAKKNYAEIPGFGRWCQHHSKIAVTWDVWSIGNGVDSISCRLSIFYLSHSIR